MNGPAGAFKYSFFFAYVLIALIGEYYNILSGETQQKICNNRKMRILFELESGVGEWNWSWSVELEI